MRLSGNVHIAAGGPKSVAAVYELLRKEGIETRANPDFFARSYKTYGIEEARELMSRVFSRAVQGSRRVFVIVADTITTEAQNALLKTLEEPPGEALFILVVRNPAALLPTVRSRAQTLDLGLEHERSAVDVPLFLKAAPAKRLEMLKPLLEKDEDDKRDIGAVLQFLCALENALRQKPASLKALYRARKYATDRGALLKPLLEQAALLI